MRAAAPLAPPDVQAQRPTLHVSPLARRRDRRREGHPHQRRTAREQLFSAKLECFVDLGPRQKGAHMSRFEEVVNDAIGEVVLGEAAFQAETLAAAHRRARARPPGRAPRRGHDRRALPRAQAGAGLRHPDAGDLHAVRLRGRVRARHAPARRRRRPGHDRVPVRAGARRRQRRASASPADGFDDDEIERIFEPSPSPRTTSAASARCTSAAPRSATTRSRRATLLDDRRGLDVVGDLRADEALRRGRRRREGPPPPALRRGLRARDDRAASSSASRELADAARSSRPARRTSRRSTSTTSSPSASGCSASCARELRDRRAPRAPHVDARVARRAPARSQSGPTRLAPDAGVQHAARPGRDSVSTVVNGSDVCRYDAASDRSGPSSDARRSAGARRRGRRYAASRAGARARSSWSRSSARGDAQRARRGMSARGRRCRPSLGPSARCAPAWSTAHASTSPGAVSSALRDREHRAAATTPRPPRAPASASSHLTR